MTKSSNPSVVRISDTAAICSASTTGDVDPIAVDVALVELAESAARRPIGAPHGLNLIALEDLRQLRLVLGHDTRERHRQVVAQREIGLAAGLVLAALENLEDELVAFLAVLAEQCLDVLGGRRLERLEPVAIVDARG